MQEEVDFLVERLVDEEERSKALKQQIASLQREGAEREQAFRTLQQELTYANNCLNVIQSGKRGPLESLVDEAMETLRSVPRTATEGNGNTTGEGVAAVFERSYLQRVAEYERRHRTLMHIVQALECDIQTSLVHVAPNFQTSARMGVSRYMQRQRARVIAACMKRLRGEVYTMRYPVLFTETLALAPTLKPDNFHKAFMSTRASIRSVLRPNDVTNTTSTSIPSQTSQPAGNGGGNAINTPSVTNPPRLEWMSFSLLRKRLTQLSEQDRTILQRNIPILIGMYDAQRETILHTYPHLLEEIVANEVCLRCTIQLIYPNIGDGEFSGLAESIAELGPFAGGSVLGLSSTSGTPGAVSSGISGGNSASLAPGRLSERGVSQQPSLQPSSGGAPMYAIPVLGANQHRIMMRNPHSAEASAHVNLARSLSTTLSNVMEGTMNTFGAAVPSSARRRHPSPVNSKALLSQAGHPHGTPRPGQPLTARGLPGAPSVALLNNNAENIRGRRTTKMKSPAAAVSGVRHPVHSSSPHPHAIRAGSSSSSTSTGVHPAARSRHQTPYATRPQRGVPGTLSNADERFPPGSKRFPVPSTTSVEMTRRSLSLTESGSIVSQSTPNNPMKVLQFQQESTPPRPLVPNEGLAVNKSSQEESPTQRSPQENEHSLNMHTKEVATTSYPVSFSAQQNVENKGKIQLGNRVGEGEDVHRAPHSVPVNTAAAWSMLRSAGSMPSHPTQGPVRLDHNIQKEFDLNTGGSLKNPLQMRPASMATAPTTASEAHTDSTRDQRTPQQDGEDLTPQPQPQPQPRPQSYAAIPTADMMQVALERKVIQSGVHPTSRFDPLGGNASGMVKMPATARPPAAGGTSPSGLHAPIPQRRTATTTDSFLDADELAAIKASAYGLTYGGGSMSMSGDVYGGGDPGTRRGVRALDLLDQDPVTRRFVYDNEELTSGGAGHRMDQLNTYYDHVTGKDHLMEGPGHYVYDEDGILCYTDDPEGAYYDYDEEEEEEDNFMWPLPSQSPPNINPPRYKDMETSNIKGLLKLESGELSEKRSPKKGVVFVVGA